MGLFSKKKETKAIPLIACSQCGTAVERPGQICERCRGLQLMNRAEQIVLYTKSFGVTLKSLEDLVIKARFEFKSGRYEELEKTIIEMENVCKMLEGLINKIEDKRKVVTYLESIGLDIRNSHGLLNLSRSALERGDIEDCEKFLGKVDVIIRNLIPKQKKENCDCGAKIEEGWQICPYCLKELTNENVTSWQSYGEKTYPQDGVRSYSYGSLICPTCGGTIVQFSDGRYRCTTCGALFG